MSGKQKGDSQPTGASAQHTLPIGERQHPHAESYKDPDWLKEMYVGKEKSLDEIASKTDVSINTISRWLKKYGIETRRGGGPSNPAINPKFASPKTNNSGHRTLEHRHRDERYCIQIHRLHETLLIEDLSELKGMEVHHKNGCPFDNRLSNYELLAPKEHRKLTEEIMRATDKKALCRECGATTYLHSPEQANYCQCCGREYNEEEIVPADYIDWEIEH